ncbi:MAG: hypothetical protein VXX77_05300 [Candidatus Thermoplasmatota archaeon]|nr:hypothetical protein [Candidatus Thermoplasmatota archaeon]
MRGALGLTALLLTTTLLLAVPAGAQSDHSTTLLLDEIGAFNNTNDVHTNEDGNDIPVLYVGETFHLKGQLNDGLGQGLGLKCLNLYVEPSANANPFATVLTDDDGRFDWFSGDTDDPLSQSGRIEPINGELVGFWSVRLAFEPQNATEGGCATDENETLLASHVDAPFLLKSRIDVVNLGLEEVQPDGVNCTEATCSGLYAGGTYILNLRLMHDRFDAGVNNVSLVYNASLNNESMTSSVQEHVVLTNSTGHAKLHLLVDPDLCCDVEGQAVWNISINGEPFFVMLSSSMEPNFNTTQGVTVLPYTDGDGDGVHDHHDACPATPANDSVMENGCSDDDHDGVPNDMDACPNQGVFGQDQNEDGCDDANQFRIEVRYLDGCDNCYVGVNSLLIKADDSMLNSMLFTKQPGDYLSSVMYNTNGSVRLGQRSAEYIVHHDVFGSNGTFESLSADLNLEFGVEGSWCSITAGRWPSGGAGFPILPSYETQFWSFDVRLIDGQDVHDERTLSFRVTSVGSCIRNSEHTIAWPVDPAMDTDGDGYTTPAVYYTGDCNEGEFEFMTWCTAHRNGVYDAFPDDPTQWFDTDGDGYGDNASGTNGDQFPNNAEQWSDTDGDGYGDNSGYLGDGCPNKPGTSTWPVYGCPDSDNDGYPEECHDNDRCVDLELAYVGGELVYAPTRFVDSCPYIAGQSYLTMYGCPDSDGDGWADSSFNSEVGVSDACPDVAGNQDSLGCYYYSGYGRQTSGGGGDTVILAGLVTALILLPILAKLFLMGVAEVRPPKIEPQTNRNGSIYDNLLNEAEEAVETDEPPEAPVHLGWLDDPD